MPAELTGWIAQLLDMPEMTRMGHAQRASDLNLGLGWMYYGLARTLRPAHVVVIGSWRGFVPLVFGRALADNAEGGRVHFIDPSHVDDFWADAQAVRRHFARFGVHNIEHHRATTQEFVAGGGVGRLGPVGILFVDGYHALEQVRYDHEAFRDRLEPHAVTLFHDSIRERESRIYGEDRAYVHQVKRYMDALKRDPALQVLDLPFGDGVTLVRRADGAASAP